MRHLLLILLITSCRCGFAQINDNSEFFNGNYDRDIIRKNKVAKITIKMMAGNRMSSYWVHTFDTSGYIKSMRRYLLSGDLAENFELEYNALGGLVYRYHQDFEFDRIDTISFYKTYSGSLLVKDSSSYLPVMHLYEYNTKGDLVKTTRVSRVWMQSGKVILNTYRPDGRIARIKETTFDSKLYDSVLVSDRKLIYNKTGKLTEEREGIKTDGKYGLGNHGTIKYRYDGRGTLTEIDREQGISCKITYDDKGLITILKMVLKVDNETVNMSEAFSYEVRE